MSTLQLDRFTRPEVLASVRAEALRRFFEPYGDYFTRREFDLTSLENGVDEETLVRLSAILLNPSRDIPHELIDALFCVHEVAITANSDLLEMTAASEQASCASDSTLLEMALAIWSVNPDALKQIHQRQFTAKVRSFEYFSGEEGIDIRLELNSERIQQMERSLAIYFEKKNRGYGCRIHHYAQDHEHWFLVTHGDLFRRESAWEDGKARAIAFRPERYDLVVYDALTEELRINAGSETLREHYRRQFGFYLFGRENHFPGKGKYSLAPLLRDGESSLNIGDVPGLDYARLTELSYAIEDQITEVRTHKAADVFAALCQHEAVVPENARLLKASFRVKFRGQPRPRSLTIKPSNVALYTRDGDGRTLEEWLRRRGFIQTGKVKGHEQLEHVLAVS